MDTVHSERTQLHGARRPGYIRTDDGVDLFYRDWHPDQDHRQDHHSRRPVLFVASWSLPSDSWSYQMLALREAGHRVVAFDRRGHGRSSDPGGGYDFDTLADDIAAVLDTLDLRDAILVGHSMGCNEIVRYLSRHGAGRVAGAALLATMTPFVLRTPDNPDGIEESYFASVRETELMVDFPRWIDDNMNPFVLPTTPPGIRRWITNLALGASLQALCACQRLLSRTDFRRELARIDLPVLLIAGKRDLSAPFALTAEASARLLPQARLLVYEDAPHGMFITHAGQVNRDLVEFAAALPHNRGEDGGRQRRHHRSESTKEA